MSAKIIFKHIENEFYNLENCKMTYKDEDTLGFNYNGNIVIFNLIEDRIRLSFNGKYVRYIPDNCLHNKQDLYEHIASVFASKAFNYNISHFHTDNKFQNVMEKHVSEKCEETNTITRKLLMSSIMQTKNTLGNDVDYFLMITTKDGKTHEPKLESENLAEIMSDAIFVSFVFQTENDKHQICWVPDNFAQNSVGKITVKVGRYEKQEKLSIHSDRNDYTMINEFMDVVSMEHSIFHKKKKNDAAENTKPAI